LAAAVEVEEGGEFGAAFWEGVDGGHGGGGSFEDADFVADEADGDAFVGPFRQVLDFEGFL
jgi:hypothetical protein